MTETDCKYEFSQEENEKLRGLVANLRNFTSPLIVFACLELFLTILNYTTYQGNFGPAFYPFSALLVVVSVCFCVLIRRAAVSFQLIIDTEGDDIAHLMNALVELTKSFAVTTILILALTAVSVGAIFRVLAVL